MLGRTGRLMAVAAVGAMFLFAIPALAVADDDDDGGGGGTVIGGITFSVQDNGLTGDIISGATLPATAPAPGTPKCGALEPDPTFVFVGPVTVADTAAGDSASGHGNVPAFGGGIGARVDFDALSGPMGEGTSGVFAVGFPTGDPSAGRITCLDVRGNIAYIGGEKIAPGGGGGDDDDGDDDDGDDDDGDDD